MSESSSTESALNSDPTNLLGQLMLSAYFLKLSVNEFIAMALKFKLMQNTISNNLGYIATSSVLCFVNLAYKIFE